MADHLPVGAFTPKHKMFGRNNPLSYLWEPVFEDVDSNDLIYLQFLLLLRPLSPPPHRQVVRRIEDV